MIKTRFIPATDTAGSKIRTLTEKIPAILLRWGAEAHQHFAFPGEYVRIAPRTWALWLGQAPSSKYIYRFEKR